MPGAFVGLVRMTSPENHSDNGNGRWDSIEKPNLHRRQTKFLDDLRRPDAKRIKTGRGAEVYQRQR
jgi:hypothetical protein